MNQVLLVIGAMSVVFHTLLIVLSCDARCNAQCLPAMGCFLKRVLVLGRIAPRDGRAPGGCFWLYWHVGARASIKESVSLLKLQLLESTLGRIRYWLLLSAGGVEIGSLDVL